MNRLVRLIKENIIPSIVFVLLVLGCASAWYFLHPSSPYHARYSFVVRYDAIGTLSPGNPVKVRGILAGEITKVELTEDAVFVTARVYASTKIPVNSEFRLINSGLMGEREMCVLTGDDVRLIHEGDTLNGHYDEGTSGVGIKLYAMLDDVKAIKDSLVGFVDLIKNGDIGKRSVRVVKKGKALVGDAQDLAENTISDTKALLERLDANLESAKSVLDGVANRGGSQVDQVRELLVRIDALLLKSNSLMDQFGGMLGKFSQQDNSVGLILAKDGQFNRDIEKLTVDIEALLNDIKKNGVKLNVDIF